MVGDMGECGYLRGNIKRIFRDLDYLKYCIEIFRVLLLLSLIDWRGIMSYERFKLRISEICYLNIRGN